MLSVVCFKWGDRYRAAHVNRLAAMVDRHLSVPHEVVCVTDDAHGLDPAIRSAPVEAHLIGLGLAYPKIAVWGRAYGRRMLVLDLDITITRSIDHLVTRPEPIVLLKEFDFTPRSPAKRPAYYNTSVMLIDHDAAPGLWSDFTVPGSVGDIRASGMIGDDQTWASIRLGPDKPVFPDGEIASFKFHVRNGIHEDAAIVVYHGRPKPWD